LLHLPNFKLIDSTYKDNDFLSPSQVAAIEANRETDPEWFKIYGLGLLGSGEGLVIKNWDQVADLPPRSLWKDAWIGVDFGWDASTAVSLVVLSQGEIYIKELLYGPKKTNLMIANSIKDAGYQDIEVICDAAEPKSIADLCGYGIKAVKSDNKEILLGLQIMNGYKKHYTTDSLGTIAENRLYRYPQLPDGTYGTIPIKKHGHAKDAERYVFLNRLSNISTEVDVTIRNINRKR
jgi:phage terminase large subunit